jgi:membrane-associated phospholipid phosphatase
MNQCQPVRSNPQHLPSVRILSLCCCAVLSGCATLPDGRGWGQDVTVAPGWSRIRSAASEAVRDPWVWAPLLGAAGTQIEGWDRRISNWARRETPLFGSRASAARWSDDLRSTAAVADFATVLLTPSGDDSALWFTSKLKGYAVDLAAASAAIGTTGLLKRATARTRPSGADDQSMPSGHVTTAASYDRLAARNLDDIDMDAGTRRALDYGLNVVTFGTAWARIEAGAHYPSDTLVSIALGNFSANFFKNAFMGDTPGRRQQLAVLPAAGGFMLHWELAL